MLRRIISGITLAAVAAAPLTAQHYFRSNTSQAYWNSNGTFTGSAPASGGFTTNASFQIWCVDQAHNPKSGWYTANVSQLSGSLSNTRLGVNPNVSTSTARSRYTRAAWLAATMDMNNQNTKQNAIWAVVNGQTGSGSVASQVQASVLGADNIDQSQWYIISDTSKDEYRNNGQLRTKNGAQEFIAHCQSGKQGTDCNDGWTPPDEETPTPEPATMSLLAMGLAGLAGNSLRRRQK